MKNFVFCIVLMFAIAGCEKATQPSGETAADYLPITPGSTWEYWYNGPYAYGADLKTGADTVINGKVFKTQRDKWSYLSRIYRFEGNDIYQLDGRQIEDLIFKMGDVGTTWTYTRQYDSVNSSVVTNTLAARDLTMEVYGNTFKNVIHVKSLVKNYYNGGTFSNEYIYHRYFAKGVGIIKDHGESSEPWFNGLKSYSVN